MNLQKSIILSSHLTSHGDPGLQVWHVGRGIQGFTIATLGIQGIHRFSVFDQKNNMFWRDSGIHARDSGIHRDSGIQVRDSGIHARDSWVHEF